MNLFSYINDRRSGADGQIVRTAWGRIGVRIPKLKKQVFALSDVKSALKLLPFLFNL